MTRLFLHVTLVVDLRERDVLQSLFFWRALLRGVWGAARLFAGSLAAL